jgi:putative hemolysin
LIGRLFRIDEVRQVWSSAMRRPAVSIHQRVLDELAIETEYAGAIDEIPKNGPLVIVANHPFGIIEGPVLGAMLDRIRQDVLFVTNSMLAELQELAPHLIAVDPFGDAVHANSGPVRRALRHLRAGGALVVFPAGEVSSLRAPIGRVADGPWNTMAARLAMAARAQVVPCFFQGQNGAGFQLAGLVHPRLRTLLLPSELLRRRNTRVRLAVGQPLQAGRFHNAKVLTDHLRTRTYSLAPRLRQRPIATAFPATGITQEIARLKPALSAGEFDVFIERAGSIPCALREIGRMREITFRAAGEGSGKPLDLDEFDSRYWHIFLWNRNRAEIAGAYRAADGADTRELYTRTLFHFPRSWNDVASRGIELGRSFVSPAYQRQFQPLLLLWKGIGALVMRLPHVRYVFGAVSISADYTAASRSAIAAHFSAWPRGFFPRNPLTHALTWKLGSERCADLEALESRVTELEPDAKGLPVLVRHYLNLGGEILCLNLDPRFGNTLDGLVLLDLRKTPEKLLSRYFGPAAVERFKK